MSLFTNIKANAVDPLLAIEGVGLGFNILKDGVDKFKDVLGNKKKNKEKKKQVQNSSQLETTVKLVFKGQYVCLEGDSNCGKFSPSGPISFNKWKLRKSSFNKNGLCMSPEFGTVFYLHTIDNCDHYEKTYSTKYYRLINLKDNVFKVDGYTGKVAIKKFDDPTGLGEGSSTVKVSKKDTDQPQQQTNKEFFSLKFCSGAINTDYGISSVLVGENQSCEVVSYSKFKSTRLNFKEENLCINENLNFITYAATMNCKEQSIATNQPYYKINFAKEEEKNRYTFYANIKTINKTQIAKVEPGKTKEAIDGTTYDWVAITKHPKRNSNFIATKLSTKKKAIDLAMMKCYKYVTNSLSKRGYNDCSLVNVYNEKNKDITQLVKKETTATPEKITKVVKAKDTNQQEFKPKNTNQDNEAPVITIAEAITVNDASYEIEGKVSDSSKNIFITVDGRTIPVEKGKFSIKRFSPVDEQIEIIATDQWGNRSQPKLVNITIDQQETIVADTFENLDPSKIKTRSDKNKVALIIGIEKYDQTPEASYANLDAKYFYEYVRKGFGVSKANIKLLVDEDANLIQSLGTINKWLPSKIKDGKTELIIFFAGHGLASSDGKELYLLPQDSDPDLLARTALSRTELFQQIIALNPKSVTMFLDTCYSGISRDEKTLLASARPVRILANDQDTPNNFTIFSASQLDQISSGLKEANHGIFSYYLMKGLEGKADNNKDKKITNGELLAYMDQNVSQKASELGRQQNPSLAGDPNKVLMSYR